jgi:glycerophosphoryl diester phosphodiesterase
VTPIPGRTAPLVIAHRGASGYRPEHTRSAYELGIAQGADAVEPDLVATKDGVLVIRHENEISGTTDVASRPEFAHLRTTKIVDGRELTGWFSEDFEWSELATVRARERLPRIRTSNVALDGTEGILRLSDLLDLLDSARQREASGDRPSPLVMVAEFKHASYFASIGLPLDELFADQSRGRVSSSTLVMESFEQSVLHQLRARDVPGDLVYLVEGSGAPADLVARDGEAARSYADHVTDDGLARLANEVDGISLDLDLVIETDAAGNAIGTTDLVARAQALGLRVFCWTFRAENAFLAPNFRIGTDRAALGDWRAQYDLIASSGVDGIFADQPALAIEARDAVLEA